MLHHSRKLLSAVSSITRGAETLHHAHVKFKSAKQRDGWHAMMACSRRGLVAPFSSGSLSSSISRDEVTKFGALASSWWDSSSNPLIGMNPIRLKYITSILREQRLSVHVGAAKPLKGLRMLDVGCGGGLLAESLARLGAETVVAIDPSEQVANAARKHSEADPTTAGIDYRVGSVENLAAKIKDDAGELFDVVCVLEVIEHATDPMSLLEAASSLLKPPTDAPGGILFLSTVNRTAKSFGIAILGAEFVSGYVPVGTHDWNQFRSPGEIQEMMESVGMKALDTCGMVLKPPFVDTRWTLEQTDLDVNWIGAYTKTK